MNTTPSAALDGVVIKGILACELLSAGDPVATKAFTGREWDPETGLYYYRARYYDPKAGRFISEDPIGFGGGANFYSYVDGDPVLLRDPFGLQGQPEGSGRVTGKYNPVTGGVTINVNVPNPYASEVQATYIHENKHRQINGSLVPWRDEQEAFRAEAAYLREQIEHLRDTIRLDCRESVRKRATDELIILNSRYSEADTIATYDSEAMRYRRDQVFWFLPPGLRPSPDWVR